MTYVAAYCRVSTDKEDQNNSFVAQQQYFKQYIQQQKDWVLSEIYADEGISGTSTIKRTQFNRMMEDARTGKFSLLLTKEVSRFARNILDAITYTRELKSLGIDVIFMTDGIHTQDADAELRLSILGSLAQEESRRTSQRVKWGQTRRMEQGVVFGHSLLGYHLENGCLIIKPDEAEIVRSIFHRYTQERKSSYTIAAELEAETGNIWTPTKILRILRNEKYVGDLVQKKTYTPNYLTHEKKINFGQEPIIYISDHHEGIVSRELWDNTQELLKHQSKKRGEGKARSKQYGFSGKIYCGKCGNVFVSQARKRKDGSICRRWCCSRSSQCKTGKSIRDSLLRNAICSIIDQYCSDIPALTSDVVSLAKQGSSIADERAMDKSKERKDRLMQKLQNLIDLYHEEKISTEVFENLYTKTEKQWKQADHNRKEIDSDLCTQQCLDILHGQAESTLFFQTLIDRITVYSDRISIKLAGTEPLWHFSFI